MISWIQRTFQRHFRIVFVVILAVMGVPLLLVYRTGGSGAGGDRETRARDFFGYNLVSAEDQRRLMDDARVSLYLHLGSADVGDEQLQTYALQRGAALFLAGRWHLPPPTAAEVESTIRTMRLFAGENGSFDPARYASFRAGLQKGAGLTEGEVARVLSDDVRAEAAERLLGGPGYVLPGDVQRQLTEADTLWTVAVGSVDYASFDPGLKPTDSDLQRYFQANAFRYELPPRVAVGYVSFPASDYLAQAAVTDAEVKAAFDADPSRFAPKPAPAAKPGQAPAKPDFLTARPQVEAELKRDKAATLALKAASDFVYALYEGKVASGAPLDSFLAERHLTLRSPAPFPRDAAPAELGGAPDVADAAFQLTPEKYYSDALKTPAGAAVLVWKQSLPARQPAFSDVRAKVLADYLDNEKRQSFVELGRTLRAQLLARLKAGEPFAKAAAAVAGQERVKIAVKTPAPFTLRTRPADLDSAVLGALERLDKGQVSDMVATSDQGYLVYAADKKLPDLSETGPQYAEARAQLAANISRFDSGAVLSELVAQELKRTDPAAK